MNTNERNKLTAELNSSTTALNFDKMVELDDKSSFCFESSFHLLKCPICNRFFDNEENCLEHFLYYFNYSQHFLFHRYNLVFWLNSYFRFASGELITNKLSPMKDKNMNTLTKIDVMIGSGLESKEISTDPCEISKESFLSEEEICPSASAKFVIPAVDFELKCPLCTKYFCCGESCLIHIFTHMKIFATRETRKRISPFTHDVFQQLKDWIVGFFSTPSSDKILTGYYQYKQIFKIPLLSRILWSEVKELKNCKLCEKPIFSVFDLLNDHPNCKLNKATKSSFCILCNFKAANMDTLMSHFFSYHIFCYCGYHGEDFDSFISHSKDCVAQKNGIVCPCCRINNFVTTEAFRNHIEETKQRTCGSILKKNQWVCIICKIQSSQQDIFDHIKKEHISCLCGYKNKDMKLFFKHTCECIVKKSTIFCPICRKAKHSSKAELQEHVSHCFPWNECNQKLKRIKAQDEKLESRMLKRRKNSI